MGVILNPSFEIAANWTLGTTHARFDTPSYSSVYAHAGSKSLLLRMNCGDMPDYVAYCYARQSITVQANHYISFWVKTNGDSGHLDGHNLWFRVLFDGNVIYSENDYNATTPSLPIYDCVDHVWKNLDYYEGQIANLNLSAYEGQTGNLEFQLYSTAYMAHLYDTRIFVDDITESYDVLTDFYVKTTGNDASNGASWANAWKTINKAATTVIDGSTVHIGVGNYNAEPAGNKIAPQNVGSSGIAYTIVNASTGLPDTGSVVVEKN